MAKSNRVLSIDITNESITIIEITASPKKQTNIHNVIIFETPEEAFEDGIIKDMDKIAITIREQLNSKGISNNNAIFVLSSTKIVNREVIIPFVKPNKIRGIINANSSEYFPVNIEDYVVSHSILETVVDEENNKQLRVSAVAAPNLMVKSYYDLAMACGLNVVALDYIGNSMLQLIKTQTSVNTTTMVIQLGSESTVLNIVQGDNLLLQRTVPYGTNSVVNVVMDDKGVDATTAMTMLQNERLITVDFEDNEVTGAFRYLINNIGRVMDYFSTKNPDKQIEDICLTGDGALIKGVDGLFKIQLNVQTRIMDTLYNIKFDPSIDLKVYNPVYLITPIGAAFEPMKFESQEIAARKSGGDSIAPYVAIVVVAALAAAGISFYTLSNNKTLEDKKAAVESDIRSVADIEQIISDYDTAQAVYNDAATMMGTTYQLNENTKMFIDELENKIPDTVYITNFTSSNEGVTMPAVTSDYDSIADFIVQLKSIECIEDAYTSGISIADQENGEVSFIFTVTCKYVPTPNKWFIDGVGTGDTTSADTTEETTTEAE